jgi:hypothetical protein
MSSRLSTAAPNIERALQSLNEAQRLAVAREVVSSSIDHVAGVPSELRVALESRNLRAVAAIAEDLDAQYFDLDEANSEVALAVFSQARVAMAARFLLEKLPFEALYEAVIATDNPVFIERVMQEAGGAAL